MATALAYRFIKPLTGAWLTAALLATTPALAAEGTPDAATLVAGLGGRWTGTLNYRDYTSNAQEQLPMITEIVALGDGATVISINRFADGPKTGIVTITDVSLFDTKAGRVTTETFRRGKAVTSEDSAMQVARYTDGLHWSIIYTRDGSDNDQPALIRLTQTRDGTKLTERNEVQPKATPGVWMLRSGTDLTRDGGEKLPAQK